jgi:hypothetical protein
MRTNREISLSTVTLKTVFISSLLQNFHIEKKVIEKNSKLHNGESIFSFLVPSSFFDYVYFLREFFVSKLLKYGDRVRGSQRKSIFV